MQFLILLKQATYLPQDSATLCVWQERNGSTHIQNYPLLPAAFLCVLQENQFASLYAVLCCYFMLQTSI
jgi:hypothetical protein